MKTAMTFLKILIIAVISVLPLKYLPAEDMTFQSGRLYGTPSEGLMGRWEQKTPFFGMTLDIASDSVKFSYFGELSSRDKVKDCKCFAFANQNEIHVVIPDENMTYEFHVETIDGVAYLLSSVEVAQYRTLTGEGKKKFEEFERSSGRKKSDIPK